MEHKLSVDEAKKLYGSIDATPLPFPFQCSVCSRSNCASWQDDNGALVLVCKCGSEDVHGVNDDAPDDF
jgi:hypothetical protein